MKLSDFVPPILIKATRRMRGQALASFSDCDNDIQRLLLEVTNDPLRADLHCKLADAYASFGDRPSQQRAVATYRTAITLGASEGQLDAKLRALNDNLCGADSIGLKAWSHNEYVRLTTVAEKVHSISGEDASVLDVGGANGGLCFFLPNCRYALAEPQVNGIDGTDLPFVDHSFDVVSASHVLEHIPTARRSQFLDNLCRNASQHVLLLNPFIVADSYHEDRLQLVLDLTEAGWAKEHLECGLPELDEVRQYASSRGISCQVVPNHCMTTSLALVFVEYYAHLAARSADLSKINELFNRYSLDQLTDATLPVGYLVHFELT